QDLRRGTGGKSCSGNRARPKVPHEDLLCLLCVSVPAMQGSGQKRNSIFADQRGRAQVRQNRNRTTYELADGSSAGRMRGRGSKLPCGSSWQGGGVLPHLIATEPPGLCGGVNGYA